MAFKKIDVTSLLHEAGYRKEDIFFDIPALYIKVGLINETPNILQRYHMGQSLALICDENSYRAVGTNFFEAIECCFSVGVFVMQHPCADDKNVEWITRRIHSYDALIAIGSGTISDLCKYVAAKEHKPYSVIATALSMNGYASCYASITMHGFKSSFKAIVPRAIIMDNNILKNAPRKLTLSGIGDSLCRATAQWDWRLSHHIVNSAYDVRPFHLVRPYEKKLTEYYMQSWSGERGKDVDDVYDLALLLILAGLGMTLSRGSHPASQSEHLIAHSYHMIAQHTKNDSICSLHGEEIGITSIYIQQKQNILLRAMQEGKVALRSLAFDEREMTRLFGKDVSASCKVEMDTKNAAILEACKHTIDWKAIAQDLAQIPHIPIKAVLAHIGAPLDFSSIGWKEDIFNQACLWATYTRNRFTCLDLVITY